MIAESAIAVDPATVWFAESAIAVDPATIWIAAFTAFSVTVGLICQVVLQLLARSAAAEKARIDEDTASRARIAAVEAKKAAEGAMAAAQKASARAEDVRVDLAQATNDKLQKLAFIADTGEKVHLLVNSAMTVQLRINMLALKRVAELTRNPEDIEAAELAEKSYREHEDSQNNYGK